MKTKSPTLLALLEEVDQKIRCPLSEIAISLQLLKTPQKSERHQIIKSLIAVDRTLRELLDPHDNLLEEFPLLND